MKNRSLQLAALALSLTTLCACTTASPLTSTPPDQVDSVAELDYANVYFDYSTQITQEKANLSLQPMPADTPLTISEENGADGVVLVHAANGAGEDHLYLNTYVAGSSFTIQSDTAITGASSSSQGDLAFEKDSVTFTPKALEATNPTDEVVTIELEDGSSYFVHTVNPMLPVMDVTVANVSEENAGIYDFALDKFLLRVDTSGQLVYYRDMNCIGELLAENFGTQATKDGTYHTFFVELNQGIRSVNGGYSNGMYLVMDENYHLIDTVTLSPNSDENHTHGEGYLDQHEFVMLGKEHYLLLGYTPLLVDNLPDSVEGIDGSSNAYVWAGVFQEVKNDTVIAEINTTDYPLLYESAVEELSYATSTDQGAIGNNAQGIPTKSYAAGIRDYVHTNSLDYTLHEDGTVDDLLVSMRSQCAVYQFDMGTGAMEWILGGKNSTLAGYDQYASTRTDWNGEEFSALTYGQHYVRYLNKDENNTISGNPIISIFDNQTGDAPFVMAPAAEGAAPNLTRTIKAEIDPSANTVRVFDVIEGTKLNQLSEGYHIASHCGAVNYFNDTSVLLGWGLHVIIDGLGADVPYGTFSDQGYEDLRQGSRPIFSEYDMENGELTFELSASRNPDYESHEWFFSYRTYKTMNQ